MQHVGLFVHPWHPYGRSVLRGVADFVATKRTWWCYTPWSGGGDWLQLPETPLDAAIVRTGGPLDPPDDFLDHLPRVVIANTDQLGAAGDLWWDNAAVGRTAGQHLLDQGHRRAECWHIVDVVYQQQRAQAAADLFREAGCEARVVGVQSVELARRIRELPRPVAIFTATDLLGRETLDAANAAGLRVPDDLALIAAGDDEIYCELSFPPMSSVALPGEEAGYEAAIKLDRVLRGEERGEPVVIKPHHVSIRHSSDALAIDDPLVARALRLIRDKAADGLDVPGVHAAVPLSRRALEVRFKKAVGLTIEQELRRVRLARAKHLLSETTMRMDDVAVHAGFPNAQRLSAVFARETGEPPTAYRRRIRGRRP